MAAETERSRMEATIRAFRPGDAAAVKRILKESPQAADWTEASLRESAGWRGIVWLVSERNGIITGFIIGRQVAEEAEILNLAVSPAKRGEGVGRGLLKSAIDEFRARGASRVFLEVRESNEAGIGFYEKRGFAKTGRRAGYFRAPDEAAVLMEMNLTA
jgi:[ribosomal protein S18]-alanine N-acetyltransferase